MIDDFVQPNNSTFIDLRLFVVINFNMFISNYYDLSDINLDDFPKNIIPIAPINSWNFNYQYDMNWLENILKVSMKCDKFQYI